MDDINSECREEKALMVMVAVSIKVEATPLALQGPFPIEEVSMRVSAEVRGVYVLSSDGQEASYVGRSDFDLQQRILQSASEGDYAFFWFDYATSPMDAYKYECELYHEYNPPDNLVHPAVPENANWRCPEEGCEWS